MNVVKVLIYFVIASAKWWMRSLADVYKLAHGSSSSFKAIAHFMGFQNLKLFVPNLIMVTWQRETHFLFILNYDGACNDGEARGGCLIRTNKGKYTANFLATRVQALVIL